MEKNNECPKIWGIEKPIPGESYLLPQKTIARSIPQDKISRDPRLERNERERTFLCGKFLDEDAEHYEFVGKKVDGACHRRLYHFFILKN